MSRGSRRPVFSRRFSWPAPAPRSVAATAIKAATNVGGTGAGGGGGGDSGTITLNLDGGIPLGGIGAGGTGGYQRPPTKNFPENVTCQGPSGPWGEALQQALWFLNVNKSGPGVLSTYVQWRGDAHVMDQHIKLIPTDPTGVDMSQTFIDQNRAILDPNGTGEVDLSGGYHDAGDYIKFGLTTGFTASTVAWSLYEFPDSFRITGLEDETLNLLRWADDYFMKSTFLDSSGDFVAFADQVGDISDHSCGWMPPELRRIDFCPRKGYFATAETPAADVTASAAAALALTSLVIKAKDTDYAQTCLKYATALYKFAAQHPDTVGNTTGGLYTSEYAADDLAWAAIWLYEANRYAVLSRRYPRRQRRGRRVARSFSGVQNHLSAKRGSNLLDRVANPRLELAANRGISEARADPARQQQPLGRRDGDHRAR